MCSLPLTTSQSYVRVTDYLKVGILKHFLTSHICFYKSNRLFFGLLERSPPSPTLRQMGTNRCEIDEQRQHYIILPETV